MIFLPGDHTLDLNVTVANIAKLTMRHESTSGNRATIVCDGLVGFVFTNIMEFKIEFLAFSSCSRGFDSLSAYKFALLLNLTDFVELINCYFHDNLGTALLVTNTNLTLSGNSNFTHNHCEFCIGGGGITALSSNLTFNGNATFIENEAKGGAFYTSNSAVNFNGISNFVNNSAYGDDGGGAIYASNNTVLFFSGTSNFTNNSAFGDGGGAIYAHSNTKVVFNAASDFISNSANFYGSGGAIYARTITSLIFNGISNFISNSVDFNGGAIYASNNSVLGFFGTSNFSNNSAARYGGALYLGNSTFSIFPNSAMLWKNNRARRGGAIYVDDLSTDPFLYCTQTGACKQKSACFFQLPGQNLKSINVQLVFKNNSADDAGSVLFGGAIDHCKLYDLESHSAGEVFDMIVHIESDNMTSTISSLPFRIYPCEDNSPNYSMSSISYTIYPGETFSVSVGACGQRNGTVPSTVRSVISFGAGSLQGFQYFQQANNICTTLNYTLFRLPSKWESQIALYADGPRSTFSDILYIDLTIHQTCPPGFNISESASSCVCEPRLAKYTGTQQCNITNGLGQIARESSQQFWVGYDNHSDGLILHPLCPFDYCVFHPVVFSFNNTNIQCAYNRSGLLCGACKEGYSLVLGSSKCWKCTNINLTLLIPFAVMGVALVFFLLVCKLTVTIGTLSGLVFYVNIVWVNRTIFLPWESTSFFSIFIAWLNLDFGIETCFYNGLDAYSKTWLQFVFPLYIWVLIGLIVLLSRRFPNLLGKNPVSVLATLILLSYAKILRTLITALYITYLEYPTNNRSVWLYDANIDYLTGKHIPLFIVAILVFVFLFLPYTLLLFFSQWLQAKSHLRVFSWVNKLKPFMDAYHAPYKPKHRYWPGLLLILRFILLLVFAVEFNPQQDTRINLLAILVGTGIVQMWAWLSGGIYENWILDAMEGSFVLNLIILAASTTYTYHASHSEGTQLAVGYTSISIALVTFIGIIAFQLANVIGITQYLRKKCTALKRCIRDDEIEIESDTDFLPHRLTNPGEYHSVPQTAAESEESNETLNKEPKILIPVYTP